MTDKEILANAIDKAITNGWDSTNQLADMNEYPYGHYHIIFLHSFAKAFWSEELIDGTEKLTGIPMYDIPAWQYHLQLMVLEEKPLKYLEKFL